MITCERHYLWRAVDPENAALERYVTQTCAKKAALKFLKKTMRRHARSVTLVTHKLRSYGAALNDMGAVERQETSRRANIRADN